MIVYGVFGEGFFIYDVEVDDMYMVYQVDWLVYFVIEWEGIIYGGVGIVLLFGGDEYICELKKMYFLFEVCGKGLAVVIVDCCLDVVCFFGYQCCYLEIIIEMVVVNWFYQ